jgi:hypothetical protein
MRDVYEKLARTPAVPALATPSPERDAAIVARAVRGLVDRREAVARRLERLDALRKAAEVVDSAGLYDSLISWIGRETEKAEREAAELAPRTFFEEVEHALDLARQSGQSS